jgi:hypothetical protein
MSSVPPVTNFDPFPDSGNNNGDSSNNTPSPDDGKDLGFLVPTTGVMWQNAPSFNTPQPPPAGSGSQSDGTYTEPPFKVNLASIREVEEDHLALQRDMSEKYNNLRTLVQGDISKGAALYGPLHSDAWVNPGYANMPGPDYDAKQFGNELAAEAGPFAAQMNPIMQKALQHIGDTLELYGNYVALLNDAGQAYSQSDRQAALPAPPSGSPITG